MPSEAELSQIAGALKQRLATAGLLIPVIVLAVLLLPTPTFALLMGLIAALAAWEWAGLMGLPGQTQRVAYAVLVVTCLWLLWFAAPRAWDPYWFLLAALWWVGMTVVLIRTSSVERKSGPDPVLIPVGLLVLVTPSIAIIRLHAQGDSGPGLVLALMMLIWIADSAAYFAGKRWGKRKLAPALSPGKTWAGLYGGLIAAGLWGALLVLMLGLAPGQGFLLVALCALTALLSVVGDLLESLLKRQRGLKDAGALLPGHGGVLDRIDSMTAAAPLFVLGLLWLENGL